MKRRRKYDNGDDVKKDGGFKGDRLKDDLEYYDYLLETFPKDSQGKRIYTKDIFPSYRDAYQTVNQQTKEYLSSPVYKERLMETNNFTSKEADYYIESRLNQLEKHISNPQTIREYLGSPPGTEFVPGTLGWSSSPLDYSNARPSQIHMNIPGILDQEYTDAIGGTPSWRDWMGYYMNPLETTSAVEDIYQHELAHSALGASNIDHSFGDLRGFLNLTKEEEELLKPDKTKANKNYRKKTHIRKPHEQAADIQGFRNFLRRNLKVDGKPFSPDMEVTEEMLQKIYDRKDLPLQPGRLKERYTLPKLVEILNNYAVNEEPSIQMAENGDDVESKGEFVYTPFTVDPDVYSTETPSGQRSSEMDSIDEFFRGALNSPIYKQRLGLQGSIRDVDDENFFFHPDHGVINREQATKLNPQWYNDDMFQQLRLRLPFQSWDDDARNQRNQTKVDETIATRLGVLDTMTTDYSSEYDNQLYNKVHHVGDELERLAAHHGLEKGEDGK
jgi:hypothetical protein